VHHEKYLFIYEYNRNITKTTNSIEGNLGHINKNFPFIVVYSENKRSCFKHHYSGIYTPSIEYINWMIFYEK